VAIMGQEMAHEQFTMPQVKLLTLVFATLPGHFHDVFSGGEIGIESLLPKIFVVPNSSS
jgi:hypothetical protein